MPLFHSRSSSHKSNSWATPANSSTPRLRYISPYSTPSENLLVYQDESGEVRTLELVEGLFSSLMYNGLRWERRWMFPCDLDRDVYLLKIVILSPLLRQTHVFFLTQSSVLHNGCYQRPEI